MRKITVSVDDETYRRARLRAAELGTSLSRLVGDYLQSIASVQYDFDRQVKAERELRATIERFSGDDRLARGDLHERE